jgi:hypothetical protein
VVAFVTTICVRSGDVADAPKQDAFGGLCGRDRRKLADNARSRRLNDMVVCVGYRCGRFDVRQAS